MMFNLLLLTTLAFGGEGLSCSGSLGCAITITLSATVVKTETPSPSQGEVPTMLLEKQDIISRINLSVKMGNGDVIRNPES